MIKSLNGPIRLNLPSDSSAILNASAPSGAIKVSSEFNASVRSLHKYSGQRGQGDCAISLKTLTGPITVAVSDEKTEANSPAVPITVPPVPPKTPEPSMPPEPPKPDQTHVYPESQHPDEDNSEKVESPEAMVDRMLQEGKISPEEARQLKSSL